MAETTGQRVLVADDSGVIRALVRLELEESAPALLSSQRRRRRPLRGQAVRVHPHARLAGRVIARGRG